MNNKTHRYLQIMILLFRPILSLLLTSDVRAKALSSAVESWLPFAVALPCARACVLSALEVINLTYERQNWENAPIVEPLPAWWWEVFCKISCEVFLFALTSVT